MSMTPKRRAEVVAAIRQEIAEVEAFCEAMKDSRKRAVRATVREEAEWAQKLREAVAELEKGSGLVN